MKVRTFYKPAIKNITVTIAASLFNFCFAVSANAQDLQADNMLLYQRSFGGWPKHINEEKLDYTKPLTEKQKREVIADSLHKDATIDNGATVKEIRYLAKAYKQYKKSAYLNAVVSIMLRWLLMKEIIIALFLHQPLPS